MSGCTNAQELHGAPLARAPLALRFREIAGSRPVSDCTAPMEGIRLTLSSRTTRIPARDGLHCASKEEVGDNKRVASAAKGC